MATKVRHYRINERDDAKLSARARGLGINKSVLIRKLINEGELMSIREQFKLNEEDYVSYLDAIVGVAQGRVSSKKEAEETMSAIIMYARAARENVPWTAYTAHWDEGGGKVPA